MARHPKPPSPSPPRATSGPDSGFDPIEEWLVDFDQTMADELAKSFDLGEEPMALPDAPEPASCDAGKVLGGVVSEGCGFGAKGEEVLEEKDALLVKFGGEFDVKMEPEMVGLGGQHGLDQLPVLGIAGLVLEEDVSGAGVDAEGTTVPIDAERSTVPIDAEMNTVLADAEMNTAASVKEEAQGGGGEEEESSSEEESESSDDEESSSGEEEEQRSKNDDESSEASSSDDEDVKHAGDDDLEALLEEGELIVGSDDDEGAPKCPIKSKHEVEVLPLVPKIEVQLEPHHQTLPVGTVSAIMGERVIVEGSVQHNPLNEGSILWITESRTPLGVVDELFGPVKNPYYLVRYNSAEEVPAGISAGTAVSFVIEFADHILNMKELYAKGYDASGDHDEDQADEPEFSDDELEAEYKRSLKQAKRQGDRQYEAKKPSGDKKRAQSRGGHIRHDTPPRTRDGPKPGRQLQPHFNRPDKAHAADNAIRPLGSQNIPMSAPTMLPPVPVNPVAMPSAVQPTNQMAGCFINPSQQFLPQQPNVPWSGGLPPMLHPNMGAEGAAFAANFMQNLLMGVNHYQQQFQNQNFGGFLNQMPIPSPQFMPQGGMPSNLMPFGQPPINPPFGAAPQSPMGQPNFGQPPHIAGNTWEQGPPQRFSNGQGFGQLTPPQGDGEQPPAQFNHGSSSFHGQRPQQRGGGRHSPGRGGGRHSPGRGGGRHSPGRGGGRHSPGRGGGWHRG